MKIAAGRSLLVVLALLVLIPGKESHAQAPTAVPPPSFDTPDTDDPLEQPDDAQGGFDFTQPLDDTTPDGTISPEFGFDEPATDDGSFTPDATTGGNAGPRRKPVSSMLDEPEEIEEGLLPWGIGGLLDHGPVLPSNECSVCSIGTCTGHFRWYGSLDYVALHRNRPGGVGFSVQVNPFTGTLANSLSTDNLIFAFEPGVRAKLGRCLGTDCKNRDHSVEFTYLGVNQWDERFVAQRGNAAPLLSAFLIAGSAVTVFDNADTHDIQYTSDFNSFQLDYKISRRLDKDRMVFRPEGTWHREAWPGFLPSVYFGVRQVTVSENIAFRATTAGNVNSNGFYTAATRNSLIGLHGGGELIYQTWKGSVGVRGGAGALTNFVEMFNRLDSVSDSVADDNFSVVTQDKDQSMAIVGDLSVIGNYRLSKQFTIHASFDMVWVGGIALAPEQLTFNVDLPGRLLRNGFAFYQGVSIGGEFVW